MALMPSISEHASSLPYNQYNVFSSLDSQLQSSADETLLVETYVQCIGNNEFELVCSLIPGISTIYQQPFYGSTSVNQISSIFLSSISVCPVHLWRQDACTSWHSSPTSIQVFCGLPLGLFPLTSIILHFLTQSSHASCST